MSDFLLAFGIVIVVLSLIIVVARVSVFLIEEELGWVGLIVLFVIGVIMIASGVWIRE